MSINCIVVTPAETAVETEASSITLPLFDGDKGVMADHAPMIGRLGNGELKLEGPEGGLRFHIEGGFVQVLDNTVSILTNVLLQSKISTQVLWRRNSMIHWPCPQ